MNQMVFRNRQELRQWLKDNALSDQGIWIVFNKQKNADTLKASEALEEALCFGWIDGQIKSIDDNTYMKYFKQRNKNSRWSEKNKKLVAELERKGLMTDFGRAKIEYAKQHGHWDQPELKVLELHEDVAVCAENIYGFILLWRKNRSWEAEAV